MSHSPSVDCAPIYSTPYSRAGEDCRHSDSAPLPRGIHSLDLSPCYALLVSDQPLRAYETLIARLKEQRISLLAYSDVRETQQFTNDFQPIAVLMDCASDSAGRFPHADMEHLVANHEHIRFIALLRPNQNMPDYVQEILRHGWLYDFHVLPIDIDRLANSLGHLRHLVQLETTYSTSVSAQQKGFGPLIGNSPEMREVYRAIKRISRVTAPVLITGESGTGKELIARTIHLQSNARDGKFVAINCAALPPSLIASELFGHEAGAYTGATRQKRGLIESAHNGTLFLDEIGDMPLDLQPYLLRFLQDGIYTRVGGTTEHQIRARLITATNADLKAGIEAGTFREDLYYRLNILTIEAPPLRQRHGDIPLLADHYLHKCRQEYSRPKLWFSKKAVMALQQHKWPGNVRELVSAVSRAAILAKRPVIYPEDLRLATKSATRLTSGAIPLARARQEFDREYILERLQQNNQNIQRTAKDLDISRVALYRLMKRYGIFKSDGGNDHAA